MAIIEIHVLQILVNLFQKGLCDFWSIERDSDFYTNKYEHAAEELKKRRKMHSKFSIRNVLEKLYKDKTCDKHKDYQAEDAVQFYVLLLDEGLAKDKPEFECPICAINKVKEDMISQLEQEVKVIRQARRYFEKADVLKEFKTCRKHRKLTESGPKKKSASTNTPPQNFVCNPEKLYKLIDLNSDVFVHNSQIHVSPMELKSSTDPLNCNSPEGTLVPYSSNSKNPANVEELNSADYIGRQLFVKERFLADTSVFYDSQNNLNLCRHDTSLQPFCNPRNLGWEGFCNMPFPFNRFDNSFKPFSDSNMEFPVWNADYFDRPQSRDDDDKTKMEQSLSMFASNPEIPYEICPFGTGPMTNYMTIKDSKLLKSVSFNEPPNFFDYNNIDTRSAIVCAGNSFDVFNARSMGYPRENVYNNPIPKGEVVEASRSAMETTNPEEFFSLYSDSWAGYRLENEFACSERRPSAQNFYQRRTFGEN